MRPKADPGWSLRESSAQFRTETALRECEERQAFLLALSDAMRSHDEASAIQAVAMQALAARLDVSGAAYYEFDASGRYACVSATAGSECTATSQGQLQDLGVRIAAAFQAGRVLADTDVAFDPRFRAAERAVLQSRGVRALVGIPLHRQGVLAGAVMLQESRPREWLDAEITLAVEAAERTLAASVRASDKAELKFELTAMTRLQELAGQIVAETSMDRILQLILDATIELTGAQFGTVQLYDAASRSLRIVAQRNLDQSYLQQFATVRATDLSACGVALGSQRPIEIEDLETEPGFANLCTAARKVGFRAVQATPFLEPGGQPSGMLSTMWRNPRKLAESERRLIDICARLASVALRSVRAYEALSSSEARFQQFAQASCDALWIRDRDTLAVEYANPAILPVYGVSPAEFSGNPQLWGTLILSEDREAAFSSLERVCLGESVVHEFRIRRPSDGAYRWIRSTGFPLPDERGNIRRIGGISSDISDVKLAAAHQEVLLAELQHRVRNIMAMIRSVSVRTGQRASTVEEFANLMTGRLLALCRVQTLLTRTANARVRIRTVVHDEISVQAQQETQFQLSGPDIDLSPKAAEILTLVVHELATNALKHGALALPEGHVDVRWFLFDRGSITWVGLDWRESGVPVRASPAGGIRRGFGTELIESRMPYELGGRGKMSISAEGARCRIEFPLRDGASILETDAPQRATVNGGVLEMTGAMDLAGERVLIVEDNYYLAADAARGIESSGAEVVGPCPTEAAALEEIIRRQPTCAVVDINLGEGPAFAVAALLKSRRIPFIFVTGYDEAAIPPEFDSIISLRKPADVEQIVRALAQTLSGKRT